MLDLHDVFNPTLDEIDVVQSICRDSFYEFVKEFWEIIIPEEPVWNWHIKYLCDELQEVAERVFQNLPKENDVIINIPPGTTKSTICSIMWPAWIWTRMPSARIISASYEHLLALNFSRRSRDIVLSEKYQRTFKFKRVLKRHPKSMRWHRKWVPSIDPDAVPITLKEDQNAKGFYENMAKGDRKAVGAGGNITGSHSHFIVVDDPINPKEAVSPPVLKSINDWMSETLPSRKVNKAVTPTVLIMQRLHQDDPTGHWLEKRKTGIKHICLPDKIRECLSPKHLVIHYRRNGGLLDPVRLSQSILDEQLLELGKYGYAGQYEQSPVPAGGGSFDMDKIQFGRQPHWTEFTSVVRYWDKAGTKDAGANTAGVKLGKDQWKRVWILDCDAGQWGITERNMKIAKTAEADGFEVTIGVEQEPGSGGKESAQTTVHTTLPGYRVTIDKVTGDKVTRAEPIAGQVGIGNVYVPTGAPWWPAMREEMRFFPFGKKKDRVDALSGAYNMVNPAVRRRAGIAFAVGTAEGGTRGEPDKGEDDEGTRGT